MLPASGLRGILLIAMLCVTAISAEPAIGNERGWEAREKIADLGEQGTFLAYVDTGYAPVASRSFRVHYWRGPCMLYWSGEEGEGGMIPMGRFRSAEIDPEGRLSFLGQRERTYLVLSPHLTDDERRDVAEAMTTIFEECHGPD